VNRKINIKDTTKIRIIEGLWSPNTKITSIKNPVNTEILFIHWKITCPTGSCCCVH
jgi:hypothetical protein